MSAEYSEKFEKPLIVVMSLFIVASLGAAIALVAAHTPTDCRSATLTYCGYESGY